MNEVMGYVAIFAGAVGLGVWLVRPVTKTWDKEIAPPEKVVDLTARIAARRHPRLELEFHDHRHWGFKRKRFERGAFAGWALHVGFGVGCLCVDLYRRGRRP